MRKHMNVNQQRIILRFMNDHPDLARGFIKGDKLIQDELWNILKNELNLAGSPIKDTTSWKKSWIDWKCNVKRKLDHNRKEVQKNNIKDQIASNQTEVGKTSGENLSHCVLSFMEEEIAQICGFHQTVDKIDNTKSFGVKKEYIAPPSQSATATSPLPTCSHAGSPQPTTSNQSEKKRKDLKETDIPCKKKRCANLEEILSEENHNLENISSKIEILAKNKSVEHTILQKIVNKLNNIDSRLGNLEKKYDKIIELEIKKLEIISQHNVLKDIRMENNASPILEVQSQPCLPKNHHKSNNAEEHCQKSSENIVEIFNFDVKEEFFSDGDSNDLDDKNLIEICDTEIIYNKDNGNSAKCLDDMSNAKLK